LGNDTVGWGLRVGDDGLFGYDIFKECYYFYMELPKHVQLVLKTLTGAGFEAYVVGGCVRDILLGRTPNDWDVTTNAAPKDIQKLFPKHFYNNRFGTVTVLTKGYEIEVTPYRVDGDYSDHRHPDSVMFTSSLREDLARRDFTINAMAAVPEGLVGEAATRSFGYAQDDNGSGRDDNDSGGDDSGGDDAAMTLVMDGLRIYDPFGGLRDLDAQRIRAVGVAGERFQEDALRLLRAVRLAGQLGFTIEPATKAALAERAESIRVVSQERIRDELVKIVMSERPEMAFELLRETGLLPFFLPEVAEGVGVGQNKHHIYTVFEHLVKSAQFAAQFGYPLHIRLAALFHDVGKPRTRRFDKAQGDHTFYGHEVVGARITERILKRLRFSNEIVQSVTHLVRHHMFYYDMGKITEAGIRRLLKRVGPENFDDLIKVRMAERKGSGVPKAEPYRLRHLQFMAEKVSQQAISVGQLKINGGDLMKDLGLRPGPVIGGILQALLAEVIEDPEINTREVLLQRADELKDKNPGELKKLGAQAAEREEEKRAEALAKKYHV